MKLRRLADGAARALLHRPVRGAGEAKRVATAAEWLLLYVMMPAWLVPGAVDYVYHRKTKIEQTSGTHESLLHAAMMTSIGLPVLMGLFLEVEAGVIAAMGAALVAHEAFTLWDVAYAFRRRFVPPGEQHAHSFLEVLPVTTLVLTVSLHPRQAAALFGRAREPARLRLRFKKQPLPPAYLAAILTGVTALVVVPYAEELLRCWRTDRTAAPHPALRGMPEPP